MDDKVTPHADTSEYKFTEAEVAPVDTGGIEQSDSGVSEQLDTGLAAVDGEQKASFKFDLKNIDWKRTVVPGLIVLAILLVYFVFSFFTDKKNQLSEQKKIVMQEDAAQVQQATFPMSATTTTTMPPITSATASAAISDDQMAQIQNTMQQKIAGVAQQLTSGQESIVSLNRSISKIQQDILAMSQKVEQLTATTQQLLSKMEKMKATKMTKKKVVKPPVAYHIRAIVPGRVWLESADGRSVTLRVGDKLEGYGEVVNIVPRQGMVIMSNGSIIQYGVDDF